MRTLDAITAEMHAIAALARVCGDEGTHEVLRARFSACEDEAYNVHGVEVTLPR